MVNCKAAAALYEADGVIVSNPEVIPQALFGPYR